MAQGNCRMQNRPTSQDDESEDTDKGRAAETRLKSSGEVVVEHHDTPPPGPPDKQIHARRPLPPVPAVRPPAGRPEAEVKKDGSADEGRGADET